MYIAPQGFLLPGGVLAWLLTSRFGELEWFFWVLVAACSGLILFPVLRWADQPLDQSHGRDYFMWAALAVFMLGILTLS